jgi:phosphoribosylanthranilate isomerase
MRTRVKVCGLTRRQDAEFAVEIGVDAIGLVFYDASPRAVTIAQAKELISGLPPFLSIVGLFVDADVDFVKDCLSALPIDLLQFHGNESPEYCEQFERPYMKAIRMKEDVDLVEQAVNYHSASALLLDGQVDLSAFNSVSVGIRYPPGQGLFTPLTPCHKLSSGVLNQSTGELIFTINRLFPGVGLLERVFVVPLTRHWCPSANRPH